MSTYLIKRSIAEHGNPRGKEPMTMPELLCEANGEKLFGYFYEKQGKRYCESEESLLQDVTHYYEPLSLPQLLEEMMPTEEEIDKVFQISNSSQFPTYNANQQIRRDGAKTIINWLKSRLLKQSN